MFLPSLPAPRKTLKTSTADWRENYKKFLEKRGRIQTLAELTAVESMQATAEETQKNREAESSAVRKSLWGSDETVKDDDMRQTILGDVTHPAPIIMQQPASPSPWPLILASLIPTAAAAGLAGYALNKQPVAPEQSQVEFDDESVSVGLGKIEDYLKRGIEK